MVAIEESMRDLRDHVFLHYKTILKIKAALAHAVRDHITCRSFSHSVNSHMDMLEEMFFVGFPHSSKGLCTVLFFLSLFLIGILICTD